MAPRDAWIEPALPVSPRLTGTPVGSVTCQVAGCPKSMPEWCGDSTLRSRPAVTAGGTAPSDRPATVQVLPPADVTVMSPQLRSSDTLASPANAPDWVGNGSPCEPLPPMPHAPNPNPGTYPTANQPPTSSPNVIETTRPPTTAAFVRWRIRPSPIPMRISGQSCQTLRTTSGSTRPVWTASGTAPATMKNAPQPSSPRLTCTGSPPGRAGWPMDMIDPPRQRSRWPIVNAARAACHTRR